MSCLAMAFVKVTDALRGRCLVVAGGGSQVGVLAEDAVHSRSVHEVTVERVIQDVTD